MCSWHHDWKTDAGLRLCGLALCGVSYLAIHSIMALRSADGQLQQDGLALFLAAAGFVCASVGASLEVLGRHIFDEVEISENWQARPSAAIYPAKRPVS